MNDKTKTPPKFFKRLLEFFTTDYNDNASAGDLEEEFHFLTEEKGIKSARKWYRRMVLKSLPKLFIHAIHWGSTMTGNYLKIAIRNLVKQKFYSAINILGLTTGMVVSVFIFLFVQSELSYDKHLKDSDRIYRLERAWVRADGTFPSVFASMAPSFAPWLKDKFPEFESLARIFPVAKGNVKYKDRTYEEKNVFLVEEEILNIFEINLLTGNKETVLKNLNSVIISQSAAKKYFGDKDPLGERLTLDGTFEMEVTGIFEDSHELSHIHFDFIGSYLSLKGYAKMDGEDYFHGNTNFSDNVTYLYSKLKKGINVEDLRKKIPVEIDKRFGEIQLRKGVKGMASNFTGINLTPVADIHLHSFTSTEIEPGGNANYVTIFSIVAFFILLIACVNFMNLSTARAMKRAREVGLRKVIGAHRKMLVVQFFGESVLVSVISVILAVGILWFTYPYLNSLTGINVSFDVFNINHISVLLSVFLFTGVAAGIYPALYLSSFSPSSILRGEVTKSTKGSMFRKALVVCQFSISITLIICVLVVKNQLEYLSNADLGYNKENIVITSANNVIINNWESIKTDLNRNPKIVSAALSKRTPGGRLLDDAGFTVKVNDEILRSEFSMPHNRVGFDFFKTYGVEFVAGRDFSIEHKTDSSQAYIINEAAVKKLGLKNPEEALGLRIGYKEPDGIVIGVVKDFKYESLRNKVSAIMTYISYDDCNTLSIKIEKGNINSTLDYINKVILKYQPDYNLNLTFLDEKLNNLYKNENTMLSLFGNFSFFAIFIASLGLLGLAAFTAEQKTKE
ncbi:MAG: ABC transporter permease, partial [Rhodothermaceae bacterium]